MLKLPQFVPQHDPNRTRVIVGVPYCPKDQRDGNDLGLATNLYFEHCLRDEDWGVVLDHDMIVTTVGWQDLVLEAILTHPEAGCFTIKLCKAHPYSRWQVAQAVCSGNHDLLYHMAIGQREAQSKEMVTDVTNRGKTSGREFHLTGVHIMKKSTWRKIGGCPHGFLYVDWGVHKRIREAGLKVYLLNRVYAYHWMKAALYPSV